MSRIKCKGCGYGPSEHDTLEGYCMVCAGNRVKNFEQLEAENKTKAKEITRLETVRRRLVAENERLKKALEKIKEGKYITTGHSGWFIAEQALKGGGK